MRTITECSNENPILREPLKSAKMSSSGHAKPEQHNKPDKNGKHPNT